MEIHYYIQIDYKRLLMWDTFQITKTFHTYS